MKLLTQGLLARRRIVLVFLLAILVPALVVGSLSLRALTERRKAVRSLLESHLSVAGDSAVRAVEAALLQQERNVLLTENFSRLYSAGNPGLETGGPDPGNLFLLDSE